MIVQSAVIHCRRIFAGRRHHDAIREAVKETGLKPVKCGKFQGFLTDKDEWLSREEAAEHAIACGQIKRLKFHTRELFSEDLY